MYSEKIDKIYEQIIPLDIELREMAKAIIRDIFAIDPDKTKHTINVVYYTEAWVNNYDFFSVDDFGDGCALNVGEIEAENIENVRFNMVDEDGTSVEERTVGDFETTELLHLVQMLNEILIIVEKEGKVNAEMDWNY